MSTSQNLLRKPINMIVAVDTLNGIGIDNTVPWDLPSWYEHFGETTTKTDNPNKINAVIMGRKTWDGIEEKYRPLEKRINVILSRDMPESISENLIFINSFEKALKLLTEEEPYKSKIETIWNIGGKDLYILGLAHPWMHKLVISRIEKAYVMDLKFPEINWKNFELNDDFDGKPVEDNGVIYRTLSYTRKADP